MVIEIDSQLESSVRVLIGSDSRKDFNKIWHWCVNKGSKNVFTR